MQAATLDNGRPQTEYANVYEVENSAPVWEHAFVAFWLFITYAPLPGVGPLRYLSIAIFIGITYVHREQVVPVLLKCWPLFTVPILGILSFTWAPHADAALRTGVLFFLTAFVIVVISTRLSVHQVLRCAMIAGALTAIYSAPYFSSFGSGGPYDGKNKFAIQMLFALLTSLAVALDSKEHGLIRAFAAVFVPITFVWQLMANSATSLVFSLVGILALFGVRFIWVGTGRIRHLRSALMLLAGIFTLCVSILILSTPDSAILDKFLGLVGKDSSFTGRTDLWVGAALASAEHPWLGVGLDGFWLYDTGLAQTLNENNHKPYGTALSFHNVFWEVRVHLGIVGMSFFSFIVGWCTWRTLKLWSRNMSLAHSALLICTIITLISTLTESYLWGKFSTMVTLFYLGAIAGFRKPEKKFIGRVPLTSVDMTGTTPRLKLST